jgi:hypothetical protein
LYEVALVEWHVTPDEINENWTEELLTLMFLKREERLTRVPKQVSAPTVDRSVSDVDLFKRMGVSVQQIGRS